MASEVRYLPNGDNSRLRQALWATWKQRCYWCRKAKDLSEVQIDHIIPQNLASTEKDAVYTSYNLPSDYDVNVVQNLAPICGPCNLEKAADVRAGVPVILSRLRKAQGNAVDVKREVASIKAAPEVSKLLLQCSELNLYDKRVLDAAKVFGPAIMRALDQAGIQFTREERFEFLGDWSPTDLEVRTSLTSGGQAGIAALGPQRWEGVVKKATFALLDNLGGTVSHRVSRTWVGRGEVDAGDPMPFLMDIEFDELIRFSIEESVADIELGGEFDGSMVGEAQLSSLDGSELVGENYHQVMSGRFTVMISCELAPSEEEQAESNAGLEVLDVSVNLYESIEAD